MAQKILSIDRANKSSLSVVLDTPPNKANAYALFVHCFNAMASDAHISIIEGLNRQGIAVAHIDICSADEKKPISIDDIRHIYAYCSEHYYAPQVLIGHSIAAVALLSIAPEIKNLRAFVAMSIPADIASLAAKVNDADMFLQPSVQLRVNKRILVIEHHLYTTVKEVNQSDAIKDLNAAFLLVQPLKDPIINEEHSDALFATAKQPKSMICVSKSTSALEKAQSLAFMISNWLNIEVIYNAPIFAPTNALQDSVVVQETGDSLYQQTAIFGNHRIFIDEPIDKGGSDSGPSPSDVLLSALASCTSITIRMYATKKNWPLAHIRVECKIARNTHSVQSEIPSSQYIMREITLTGQVDNIQRARLVDIANKCPVEKKLSIKVITRLVNTDDKKQQQ